MALSSGCQKRKKEQATCKCSHGGKGLDQIPEEPGKLNLDIKTDCLERL